MRSNLADVQQRMDQESQAQIDAVIAEFDGATDASAALAKMAEEILYWRSRMQQLAEVVAKRSKAKNRSRSSALQRAAAGRASRRRRRAGTAQAAAEKVRARLCLKRATNALRPRLAWSRPRRARVRPPPCRVSPGHTYKQGCVPSPIGCPPTSATRRKLTADQ